MSPVRTVTYVPGPDPGLYGAGDGNRTHVRSLESFCSTTEPHPLVVSIVRRSLLSVQRFQSDQILDAPALWTKLRRLLLFLGRRLRLSPFLKDVVRRHI